MDEGASPATAETRPLLSRPTRPTRSTSPDPKVEYASATRIQPSPISILSPTPGFSSSAHSFHLRSPPPASSLASPSSGGSAACLDGPLVDLLPSAVGSPTSGSSTDDGGSLPGRWARQGTGPEYEMKSTPARRIVSAPLGLWSTSPPRSSPLSQSFSSMFDDPVFPHYPSSPPSSSRPSLAPAGHRRRRSSASQNNPSFGPLVGSFENSLLSGRMSAQPSKPLPFTCSIGVLGSRDAPKRLQCPRHLHVDFGAVFYSSKEDRGTSPYVGTVDLEGHFVSLLSIGLRPTVTTKVPKFPGYQVPVRGQVQIVLKNSNQTAFKPFLVPYDLEGLNRRGRGGRTFLRQKSYQVEREDDKGRLRFAIHLTFCSPPLGTKEPDKEPKYYLYQFIRVVFAAQALDPTEKVRVVLEGPAELLHGSARTETDAEDQHARQKWRESQFGEYRGPGDDWELGRKELRAALKQKAESGRNDLADSSAMEARGGGPRFGFEGNTSDSARHTTHSEIPSSPHFPTSTISASAIIPRLDATVPTTFRPHPLSMSTTFSSPVSPVFPPLHPAPGPLTFGRVPSPVSTDLVRGHSRDRKQSAVSGLSLSRPNSPALFTVAHEELPAGSGEVSRKAGSREREICGR